MSSRYLTEDILNSEIFYGKDFNSPCGSKIYNELKMTFSDPTSMVELGSGLGGTAAFFNLKNYIGIDLSEDMVKISKKRYGEKKFICGDFLKLCTPMCDVFFTREVFMYLSESMARQYAQKIFSTSKRCVYIGFIKGNTSIQFDNYCTLRNWTPHTKKQILHYFREYDSDYTDISHFYGKYLEECLNNYKKINEISGRARDKLKYINNGSLKWCYINFTRSCERTPGV